MTEIPNGKILPVEQYNRIMTRKWNTDYSVVMDEVRAGRRQITELPQLAFYLFFDTKGNQRKRGYVLNYEGGAMCFKTKAECVKEKIKKGL